jgi:hypothetical protein
MAADTPLQGWQEPRFARNAARRNTEVMLAVLKEIGLKPE